MNKERLTFPPGGFLSTHPTTLLFLFLVTLTAGAIRGFQLAEINLSILESYKVGPVAVLRFLRLRPLNKRPHSEKVGHADQRLR